MYCPFLYSGSHCLQQVRKGLIQSLSKQPSVSPKNVFSLFPPSEVMETAKKAFTWSGAWIGRKAYGLSGLVF